MKTLALLILAAALSGCVTLDVLKTEPVRVYNSVDCTKTVATFKVAGIEFTDRVADGDAAVLQAIACNQALANAVKAQQGRTP